MGYIMHEINERGGDGKKAMKYAKKAYQYMQKFVDCLEEDDMLDERYDEDDFDERDGMSERAHFGDRGHYGDRGRFVERDEMGERRGVRGTGRYGRR